MSAGASKLCIGTAQLTRRYGIASRSAVRTDDEAIAFVRRAAAAGVGAFDTAPVYGSAERVLGAAGVATPITTKVPVEAALETFERSRADLRRDVVDAVLFHDPAVLTMPRAADRLSPLVGTSILRLGVSVYTPDEFATALRTDWVEVIQAPVSVADRRLQDLGLLDAAAAAGCEVVARSAFLQGALLLSTADLPPALSTLAPHLDAIDEVARAEGTSRVDVLVRAVRDLPGIDLVVLGLEDDAQLDDALASMAAPALGVAAREALAALPRLDDVVLDPRTWS
jgi:aryl-alcohol dehydrogenase-like predicted oxidoreductase